MNTRGIKKTELGVRHFKQIRTILKSLKNGVSITQACKAANIDPATLYVWRRRTTHLDDLMNDIIDSRIQIMEDAHYKKGIEGSVVAQIFFLCNRAPQRWHNVADIKNIIYNMNQAKTEESVDRFKEAPRVVFTD